MAQSVAVAIRNPADSKLSKSVTVAKYQEYEAAPNPKGIADFIQERFTERYILPMTGKNKHGFAMMAVSCLMIETLESFKQGWLDTNKKTEYAGKRRSLGEVAFHEFFQGNPLFKDFIGVEEDFWKGVRCGILHQGETTRGWHIVRKKQPLFLLNPATKTIDAG
jgi:hypothetical protein